MHLKIFFVTIIIIYSASRSSQIINGYLADISDYPFLASIQVAEEHICGGSIIDAKYILTAASCIDQYVPQNLSVRVGSSFYKEGGQLVSVSSINMHPEYNQTINHLNNLAILEVSPYLVLGKSVAVISTTTTDIVNIDDRGTIAGWGIVDRNRDGEVRPYQPSEQLRFTDQPIVGPWVCEGDFVGNWNESTMFCAGISHIDNCVGDTGNPFIIGGNQIGVVADTPLVCGEYSSAYANLTTYSDIISKFIN